MWESPNKTSSISRPGVDMDFVPKRGAPIERFGGR